MGDFLIFILHAVLFIGVIITTLFLNEWNTIIAIGFDVIYLITVKQFFKELENQ